MSSEDMCSYKWHKRRNTSLSLTEMLIILDLGTNSIPILYNLMQAVLTLNNFFAPMALYLSFQLLQIIGYIIR